MQPLAFQKSTPSIHALLSEGQRALIGAKGNGIENECIGVRHVPCAPRARWRGGGVVATGGRAALAATRAPLRMVPRVESSQKGRETSPSFPTTTALDSSLPPVSTYVIIGRGCYPVIILATNSI